MEYEEMNQAMRSKKTVVAIMGEIYHLDSKTKG